MPRLTVVLVLLAILAAGCMAGMGERILQVKARPVAENGKALSNCTLSLKAANTRETIQQKPDLHPEFISSFVNPPRQGQYYVEIGCAGREGTYQSGTYDFAKGPYFHDFGTVVIRK